MGETTKTERPWKKQSGCKETARKAGCREFGRQLAGPVQLTIVPARVQKCGSADADANYRRRALERRANTSKKRPH